MIPSQFQLENVPIPPEMTPLGTWMIVILVWFVPDVQIPGMFSEEISTMTRDTWHLTRESLQAASVTRDT